MKLLSQTELDDKHFRNPKTQLFYPHSEITAKIIAILGYSDPFPKELEMHYYALAGKNKLVVEVYQKDMEKEE